MWRAHDELAIGIPRGRYITRALYCSMISIKKSHLCYIFGFNCIQYQFPVSTCKFPDYLLLNYQRALIGLKMIGGSRNVQFHRSCSKWLAVIKICQHNGSLKISITNQ